MSGRTMVAVAGVVGTLLAGATADVRAQRRDTGLARLPGREVRFRTGLEERRGYLLRLDADTMVVREGRGTSVIARARLVTLDVRRSARYGAITGGILGALAGGTFGALSECSSDEGCRSGERAINAALLAAIGGVAGGWYLSGRPGWRRLIPGSGVPGPITLAEQAPAPLSPAAPDVHPETPAESASVAAVAPAQPAPAAAAAVRADTPAAGAEAARVPIPAPAPELPASALVGRWVRVVTETDPPREGPVVRVDSASLVLARNGRARELVAIPRVGISELWVSRADRPMTREGAIAGAIPGGIAGLGLGVLAIAAVVRGQSPGPGVAFGDILLFPLILAGGTALGTGTGALIGGLIGAHTMHRDWQPVSTPPQVALSRRRRG